MHPPLAFVLLTVVLSSPSAATVILGFDAAHLVERVALKGVSYLGQPASSAEDMKTTVNGFAKEVNIMPCHAMTGIDGDSSGQECPGLSRPRR